MIRTGSGLYIEIFFSILNSNHVVISMIRHSIHTYPNTALNYQILAALLMWSIFFHTMFVEQLVVVYTIAAWRLEPSFRKGVRKTVQLNIYSLKAVYCFPRENQSKVLTGPSSCICNSALGTFISSFYFLWNHKN